MTTKIDERVEVNLVSAVPQWVFWRGRTYQITKIGLHHTYCEGRILYHIFSVVSQTLFFRLKFNTENLFWTLEEIDDGLPN
jgi:hypothetical protein